MSNHCASSKQVAGLNIPGDVVSYFPNLDIFCEKNFGHFANYVFLIQDPERRAKMLEVRT